MKLSEFKQHINTVQEIQFLKSNGSKIPKHFHITEVGQINKKFIDCGGTVRNETKVSIQLWESIDLWHRIEPSTIISIIDLSIEKLDIENNEIEIECQGDTIEKYGLQFNNGVFILTNTSTACLASDKCGIPSIKKVKETVQSCCSPNNNCC